MDRKELKRIRGMFRIASRVRPQMALAILDSQRRAGDSGGMYASPAETLLAQYPAKYHKAIQARPVTWGADAMIRSRPWPWRLRVAWACMRLRIFHRNNPGRVTPSTINR